MPILDPIINDSSQSDTIIDSSGMSLDTNNLHYYRHKKIIFHYEYSPFMIKNHNLAKLFEYTLPNLPKFHQSQLIVKDIATNKLQTDSIALETDSTILLDTAQRAEDTIIHWAEKTFILPIDYNGAAKNKTITESVLPDFIKQIDSSNRANNQLSNVYFGKKVIPPNKNYFNNTEYVKIESVNYSKINWMERDWLFWPLAVLFVYFIITRFKHRSFINQIVTSVLYSRMSVRLLKEKNESTSPIIQSLLFFYFITTGIFVYMSMNFYNLKISFFPDFIFFIIISLIITLLYFIKILSIKSLGFVFEQKKVVQEYIHNVKLFNITTGIILLPLAFCIPFLNAYIIDEKSLIYAGFFTYFILFIMQLIRGFLVSYRQSVSIFYIFLYLCILEIIPLAVILKIVTL